LKINITDLGLKKKTAIVKPTMKVIDQSQLIQIGLLELDDPTVTKDLSMVEMIKRTRKTRQDVLTFIQDIFKLSDTDINKIIANLTENDLGNFLGYVTYRLQGFSDEQYELENKKEAATETDPKKD
jgi:hypothetical protein